MKVYQIIAFFLLLFSPLSLAAQQHNFNNYSLAEGLPQSEVSTMLEDQKGYLWLGTKGGGLCKFDGKKIITYTTKDGLASNYIQSIFEDKKGTLWIGTTNGINQFKEGQLIDFGKEVAKNIQVNHFLEDLNGRIWLATNSGLYYIEKEYFVNFFQRIKQPKNTEFYTLYQDANAQIWAGGKSGLFKINNQTVETISQENGAACTNIRAIAETQNGVLWIAAYNEGIYLSDGQKILRQLDQSDGLISTKIQTIHIEETGAIWLGTADKGIAIWQPKTRTFTRLTNRQGLANNDVKSIIADSWGNKWIGTLGGGVSKYSGQQFEHFTKASGLKGNYIYALTEDTKGQLWVATSGNGLQIYKAGVFSNFGENSDLENTACKALLEDDLGHLWFGTRAEGLTVFLDSLFLTFTSQNGLAGNSIIAIQQDSLGNIWTASENGGITKIAWNDAQPIQSVLTKFTTQNGLPTNRINDLHIDQKNRIWVATNGGGIALIDGEEISTVFNKKNGLKENIIRSFTEDDLGFLWYGTASKGIGNIALYETDFPIQNNYSKLKTNNIKLLKAVGKNSLWIGSETGLDYLKLDAARAIVTMEHFGKTDGFKGIETSQNVVLEDQGNNLWFGTVNGLTKYNKSFQKRKTYPPKLTLKNARLLEQDFQETPYKNQRYNWTNLNLPYHHNDLSFEVEGLHLSYPNEVVYQWKLEGLDKEWSVLTTKKEERYRNLPAGNYNLKVRATSEKETAFSETLNLPFTIASPFWERWWFRLAVILVGLLVISLFIKWRIRKVQLKAKRIQDKLELEKKLLELEQKALQLQMNPHFIFNALNSIQGSINPKDIKTARLQLAKFSKLMRATLENARTPSIPLEDEITMLSNYLSLEQFSNGNTFDYEIKVADTLDPEAVYIPPMILQPFVENAIIHGVLHLATRGKITVQFTRIGKRLNCIIEDNGIGRAKAKELKSQIAQQHKSAALDITRERLDLMRSGKAAKNSLQIIDLKDEVGEASGTRVEIIIPVEED